MPSDPRRGAPDEAVRRSATRPNGRFVPVGLKLAVATIGVLLFASSGLFLGLTERERRSLVSAKVQAAEMVVDLFAASVAAPIDFDDDVAVEQELAYLANNPEVTCAIAWRQKRGAVSAPSSRGACSAYLSARHDDTLREVTGEAVVLGRLVRNDLREPVGHALVAFSLDRENRAYASSRRHIFWLSLGAAAAVAFMLLLVTRLQIVLPLAGLRRAANRMEAGDLDRVVSVRSNDEIGDLAHALNTMRLAIAEREESLRSARQDLKDLFDHMRQAICAFDRDGRVVGPWSRNATVVFGDDDLAGKDVRHLLFRGRPDYDADVRAFIEWREAVFELEPNAWAELEGLAPTAVETRRTDGTLLPLEIELRPVSANGVLLRVMLLATDVTEKRRLEQRVASQEEELARRITAMRRLVAGGAAVFVDFLAAARGRAERALALLHTDIGPLSTNEIDELFRLAHTLRGEARVFDQHELATEVTALEERLHSLRTLRKGAEEHGLESARAELGAAWEHAQKTIETATELFVAASPLGRAALDQTTVSRKDLDQLFNLTKDANGALQAVVSRLSARPFGESAANLEDQAPAWAEKLGKRAHLSVLGRDIGVPPELAKVLRGALTQLVRNAVAHGIEPLADREASGKPPTGEVTLTAIAKGDRGPTIVVEDDGAGIRVGALRAEAGPGGADASTDELLFKPGVTTQSPGDLAGFGVGLDAVRADLATAGYGVRVEFEAGRWTRVTVEPVAPRV